jgi:PAS domain S-box-containing protein
MSKSEHEINENKLAVNILESITDAFFALDLDWKFTYVNNVAEKLLNKNREQLIGKSIWDEFPRVMDSPFHNEYYKALAEQKSIIVEEFYPPLDKWFSIRLFPSSTSLSVFFQDITEKIKLLELEKEGREKAEKLVEDLKTQQKTLIEGEERFRLLSDAIPQIVWAGDKNGYIDYYNKAWYDYSGITFSETKERGRVTIVHPDDVAETTRIWDNALKTKEPFELKYRLKRFSDGTYRWHLSRGLPFKDENGNVLRWFGTATDVDDQVRSELTQKFLAEAGALLSSSIDYETTLQNIARMAVPQFADWASVDLVKNNEIVRIAVAHQDPAKVELANEMVRRFPPKLDDPTGLPNVIRTGISEYVKELPDSVIEEIEVDEETKQLFRDLRLKSYMIVPLKLNDQVIGGISFVNEQSNKMYSEKDLEVAEDLSRRASMAIHNSFLYQRSREMEENFRFLSEAIPQQIWTALPDGSLDYVNQRVCYYFNLSSDEIIGQGWQNVIHPEDLPVTVNQWTTALTTGNDYQTEFRLLRAEDNQYRWHIGRAVPLKNERDEVVKWFGTNTDIHELKEIEEELARKSLELEHSNNELQNFAYVASHDLQEPLRTISSFTSLLQKRNKDNLDQDSGEFMGIIIDASKRMKSLIEDLLEYSQVGKQKLKKVDLNETINNIISNLKTIIQENNAEIIYENLPVIKAVPSQMVQLFQNLIANSIKYRSEKDPVINIKAEQSENEYLFSVADNGIGINKDYFEKIFIIFQRLHEKSKFSGTGIGLATCKKIIDLHKGKIWLESEEGKGTTFYFTIAKLFL